MEFSVKEIANILGGTVKGDENVKINTFAKIEEGVKNAISFLANPKYLHYIYETNSSAVIINKSFVPEKDVKPVLIVVDDAYASFAKLLEMYEKINYKNTGISDKATICQNFKVGKDVFIGDFVYISENVQIGDNCKIFPFTYIGTGSKIGNNCTLFPLVSIYHDVIIGNNCVFNSGCVIGADGFGYAPLEDGTYKKIQQIGTVIIEDNVELGANSCIDRATMGQTIIRKGVKLDNLVQIGHNVEIGENTVCSAQAGIAGSSKIGKNTMWGGQSGCANHLTVADKVWVAAQSGIASNVNEVGKIMMGSPAIKMGEFKRSFILQKHLAEMVSKIDQLESRIKDLESK